MTSPSQNGGTNPYRSIENEAKAQIKQVNESHKRVVARLSSEYDTEVETNGTGFQTKIYDRAKEIQSALHNANAQGLSPKESLASLREFGIASPKLLLFLQGKHGEEQLEIIKRIIHPKGIDFKACVFGSRSLQQIEELRSRLEDDSLTSSQIDQINKSIRHHELSAKNIQNSLVSRLISSNEKIPSYLNFMAQIGTIEGVLSQEEKYQVGDNIQGITIVRAVAQSIDKLNQSKQNIYHHAQEAKTNEHNNSIHHQTLREHEIAITTSSYKHVSRAREALGIPIIPEQEKETSSYLVSKPSKLESTQPQQPREDYRPNVVNWEKSLQEYCKRNNMNLNNLSESDVDKAAEVLLQKGFKKDYLKSVLLQTNHDSALAKVLDKTITHQLLNETRKQFESYVNKGGDTEKALEFFLKNEKVDHLDSMLALAIEKGEVSPLTDFLLEARSRTRDYSNIG